MITRYEGDIPGAAGDYDRSIHTNPDAKAWAEFFNETLVQRGLQPMDPELMIGWFANAMMAMYGSQRLRLEREAAAQVSDTLRTARHQLQYLRRRNEILEAQLRIVEVFGRIARQDESVPHMPSEVSAEWMCDQALSRLEPVATPEQPAPKFGGISRCEYN